MTLKEAILDAKARKVAIGHFNVSNMLVIQVNTLSENHHPLKWQHFTS